MLMKIHFIVSKVLATMLATEANSMTLEMKRKHSSRTRNVQGLSHGIVFRFCALYVFDHGRRAGRSPLHVSDVVSFEVFMYFAL
jgi:hypothetical protein